MIYFMRFNNYNLKNLFNSNDIIMSKLEVKAENHKIFVFKKIFEFGSAKQQAEKKKVNAFGMLAKFNFLKRPTEETVHLKNHILRYEPFWFVSSERNLNYDCVVTYSIPVHNPHAKQIQVYADPEQTNYPVTRQQDKGKIELQMKEVCSRKIEFSNYFDGLQRELKSSHLAEYVRKFELSEVEKVEVDNVLQPLLSLDSVTSIVRSELQNQKVHATNIIEDAEEITQLYLYFCPVYAFEYIWSNADKIGVIEVDGLTGEVIEQGSWFRNTFDQAFTKENLVELSAELASTVVPGGGTLVKVASKAIPL